MLNPLLQVPRGEQDAFGLGSGSVPLLAEAVGECLLLLCGAALPEKSTAYADLVGIEASITGATSSDKRTRAARYAGDLPTFAAICSCCTSGLPS